MPRHSGHFGCIETNGDSFRGEFRGLTVGHFRYGPYDLNDIVCDLPYLAGRRDEILAAVEEVNGRLPERFLGKSLEFKFTDPVDSECR